MAWRTFDFVTDFIFVTWPLSTESSAHVLNCTMDNVVDRLKLAANKYCEHHPCTHKTPVENNFSRCNLRLPYSAIRFHVCVVGRVLQHRFDDLGGKMMFPHGIQFGLQIRIGSMEYVFFFCSIGSDNYVSMLNVLI